MQRIVRQPDLGSGSIPSLMLRLALPSVIAQTINMLYNMVDRMYIGRIEGVGAYALTGVGLTFPIITLISAFSSLFGTGGAPLASIKLGEGNKEHASRILGVSAFMLLCTSVLLFLGFQSLMNPLLMAFGASENTLPYAEDYLRIYLFGTCFVQLSLGLNAYISAQGRATAAMLSVVIGAVLNIVLDPVFIFALDMGVRGAALATVISQGASCLWVVRTLASDLGVNLHTVNKAYALLRDEGHLVMRGRNGAQVTDFAQAASASAQTEGDRHMTESLLQLALEHRARGGAAETFVEAAREQARRAFSEYTR